MFVSVYLSLGGNFEETPALMHQALEAIKPLGCFLQASRFYETSPFEAEGDRPFFNAVCCFSTLLPPFKLFQEIETIEKKLGKKPKEKWEKRPIDIDLLFYGELYDQSKELKIPHARWQERLFVLVPLLELTDKVIIQETNERVIYHIPQMVEILSKTSPDWVKECSA